MNYDKFNYDDGAEITLYYNGEQLNIGLSALQVKTIVKILGLKLKSHNEILEYDDKTLQRFWQMENNPLKLEKKT